MTYDLEGRGIASPDELHRHWLVEMELANPETISRPEEASNFICGESDREIDREQSIVS
jgi:hypothetical protein